jgi:hypothetical protein
MHYGMCLIWSSDRTFKSLQLKRKSDVSAFITAPACKHIPTALQFILRNHQNTGDWNDTCQPIWSQDFKTKCMHAVEISAVSNVTPDFCHYYLRKGTTGCPSPCHTHPTLTIICWMYLYRLQIIKGLKKYSILRVLAFHFRWTQNHFHAQLTFALDVDIFRKVLQKNCGIGVKQ